MTIGLVFGTRPEIVKLRPVVRSLQAAGETPWLAHTGQHYTREMDRVFLEHLGIPEVDVNLQVGSALHGEQTGRMLIGLEAAMREQPLEAVLVQGDTNSVLAGALAATKLGIPVGHVEAGLRSGDRRMPEEINRILTDHMSDWLYAPTRDSARLLRAEGIPDDRIIVTGNTVVDALMQNAERAAEVSTILDRLELGPGDYCVATLHRQENVDDPPTLRGLLRALEQVADQMPVILPLHPRSRARLEALGRQPEGVRVMEPLDYLDFMALLRGARLVMTDSGGIQEEACSLAVPCVTLRTSTERPETVAVGANVVAGIEPAEIAQAVARMLASARDWHTPFGDGRAGERIVEHVLGSIARS